MTSNYFYDVDKNSIGYMDLNEVNALTECYISISFNFHQGRKSMFNHGGIILG